MLPEIAASNVKVFPKMPDEFLALIVARGAERRCCLSLPLLYIFLVFEFGCGEEHAQIQILCPTLSGSGSCPR